MTAHPQHGDWRDGFLFLGNQLALDFVNTRPFVDGDFHELLPDVPALLRWFVAAGLIDKAEAARLKRNWIGDPNANGALGSIREFRELLRQEIEEWQSAGVPRRAMLKRLNQSLADHPMRTRIRSVAGQALTELWFPVDNIETLFAPLAYFTAKLFTEADRTRVRKCHGCVLYFLDTSKRGTRQWCSMQLCGNRSKVAAYTARQRLVPG
jgi:predicted RNA-binding Zn ribbon-like protein